MTQSVPVSDGRLRGGDGAEYTYWREHTQISLSPVAAPSVLGLFGFAVSTFAAGANLAGWYGNDTMTPLVIAPFAFAFGGVAQLLAGMWAYRARDVLATGVHGAWGSFWIGYGLYQLLIGLGVAHGTTDAAAAGAFGFWFAGLAAVTWTAVAASAVENMAVMLTLLSLAVGSTLEAIALIGGFSLIGTIAAYVLLVSAVVAWYTGSAMVLEATHHRVILPVGQRAGRSMQPAELAPHRAIQFDAGEPGVKAGQ